ncbi:hypothetical protein EDD37DRAFT_383507 [Exophiala viscosa]|uniref:Uncharacterized protein n=1 Tax=Exophiala viscosa TaxID=2486360 RepID=A0AAN6DMW6_9EURO|nr:hypothetical protein EDD36DRAFT_95018 [Exophiala viscosa]KAI1625371.1 hypothetical protein EDD37DRAFT_383507 [Exophiala viscosa]
MGCGGSKLKGDDVPNVNSQPVPVNQPLKKVNTNFSTIDYDQNVQAQHRRLTEYAPHETARAPSLKHDMPVSATEQQQNQESSFATETFGADGTGGVGSTPAAGYPHDGLGSQAGLQRGGNPNDNGAALKPYQTNDPTDWDRDRENGQLQSQRHDAHHHPSTTGMGDRDGDRDPTSLRAKDEFAEENDPANQRHGHHDLNGDRGVDGEQNHDGAAVAADFDDDDDENKKSWLGQKYASFQSAKQGTGVSDDDLKTYTGKDRAEFDDWAANQPGVGGRQASGVAGSHGAYVAPYAPN